MANKQGVLLVSAFFSCNFFGLANFVKVCFVNLLVRMLIA